MDALYFRVSSDRQTTENQFEDLVAVAQQCNPDRDWFGIRRLLSQVVFAEDRSLEHDGSRIVYGLDSEVAARLIEHFVYVDQGRSGKRGAKARSGFARLQRDAAVGKFKRVLVWKVSRLGRDMREVISNVFELSDLGIEVFPIKSQTGPISSSMGRLLWAIQAWSTEMENEERSEAVKAGQKRAREQGKLPGRPRRILDRSEAIRLREQGHSWSQIGFRLGVSPTSVRRAWDAHYTAGGPCQKYEGGIAG
ncbi:MAG: recombinase family protein [Acidobacteria bacterium]|nr:recombinase family protein [Acidobacteriota bacterium]